MKFYLLQLFEKQKQSYYIFELYTSLYFTINYSSNNNKMLNNYEIKLEICKIERKRIDVKDS